MGNQKLFTEASLESLNNCIELNDAGDIAALSMLNAFGVVFETINNIPYSIKSERSFELFYQALTISFLDFYYYNHTETSNIKWDLVSKYVMVNFLNNPNDIFTLIKYQRFIDWDLFWEYQTVPESILIELIEAEKYGNGFDTSNIKWDIISVHQDYSNEFRLRYIDKINWEKAMLGYNVPYIETTYKYRVECIESNNIREFDESDFVNPLDFKFISVLKDYVSEDVIKTILVLSVN